MRPGKRSFGFAAGLFILCTLPAFGQDGMKVRRWPPFQVFSMTGEVTVVVPPGAALGPARDYRVLWADPAITSFVGPSENDWDFNRPDGVPGFGSLPQSGGER